MSHHSPVVKRALCRTPNTCHINAGSLGSAIFRASRCYNTRPSVTRKTRLQPGADSGPALLSASNTRVSNPLDQSHGSRDLRRPILRSATTSALHNTAPAPPTAYAPPSTGLLSYLPKSWVPYAELIRLDKPTGTYYLYFPCLFSTLLAAPLTTPITPPLTVLGYSALFLTGALIMRGAGCTINDLWDRNLDPHVARTRLRPIARGAISPRQAVIFTGAQLLTGLAVLLQFPPACLAYGVPSLALVATYPLAKRVTHYPQFVLGLTFSWGAIMGFPALGVDLLADARALQAAALLYASCVSWTVLYDMIYAHMDIKDDVKAGIKSIALRHKKDTKVVLTGLAVAQVGLLAAAGAAVGAGPVFFVGSCGSAVATLGTMIWRVNLKDVGNCWWWFKYGCWFTGGGVAAGLLGEYVARLSGLYGDSQGKAAVAMLS